MKVFLDKEEVSRLIADKISDPSAQKDTHDWVIIWVVKDGIFQGIEYYNPANLNPLKKE